MGFSFFFRDVAEMDLILQYALPELMNNTRINIWSAGCSAGQEPYTLAIKLRENMGYFSFKKVKIYATDIDNTNEDFGTVIRNGCYQRDNVIRIPPEILSKYFTPLHDGCEFQIIDEIKNVIEYQKHDLLSYQEIRSAINVIMCKNVLLHLHEEQRIEVIKMFYRALADKGFFIMERTQEMPAAVNHLFERVTNSEQFFRKK